MRFKSFFTSSLFLKSIFVVSLFLLLFISAISYRHSFSLKNSTQSLVHSYDVQIELEQLMSHLKDAETGQRGYILSKDSSFLTPYNGSRARVNQSIAILEKLTFDNLLQQKNLDSLHKLIDARYTCFENSLRISNALPLDSKLLKSSLQKGQQTMDNVRLLIDMMIKLEMIDLRERQKKYESENSITPLITLLLLVFSLLVFIFSYLKINKDLLVLKKSIAKLHITNASIRHAEEIGDFSSWQWNLETNQLTYSDNFYRLLGCPPQSFEANTENFIAFVHPSDKHIVTDGVAQVMGNGKTSIRLFRIIRRDGELRHFKSIGKFIIDDNGKKMLIGITSDVTLQHESNEVLEERNKELEQSNKELASFNHIASHDLQEPLRKIQTFISRLTEEDFDINSSSTKEYFEKIRLAADRMRILIDDLLMFSRTNKIEKAFVNSDLNILLANAQQELSEIIEEKKAVITSMKLPKLKVIPFQMHQLLTNLLGNSLKYCSETIEPIIKIECEKIMAKTDPLLKLDTDKKFYKISIIDNGLGFEQKYADNIFNLFQRLHHSNEYPGTGIGLSICKKIIENHSGFILALGKPNKGATFIVYLPA